MSILAAILAVGLLIVVHEAGHYFVARWCKMRVDRFSIGFGPAILSWRRGETDFTLGPIPFGGFVQIHGMTIADEVEADDSRAYPNRPAWQRFVTILAGPATNYIFAVVLGVFLYSVAGVPTGTSWWVVSDVNEEFNAAGALQANDRILAINGDPIYFSYEGEPGEPLTQVVNAEGGAPLAVTVLRDGEEKTVEITPKVDRDVPYVADVVTASRMMLQRQQEPYLLGISLGPPHEERKSIGFVGALGEGFSFPVKQTELIVVGLYKIVSGKEKGSFVGPVGITKHVKRSIDMGWIRAVQLLMLLNVYLGLFNLLPLPALDGGRLAFLSYELATRRRANPKLEAAVHMVGIMAILLLLVVVSYQEIADIITGLL